MLDSQDENLFQGALAALHKICEDSPDKLAADVQTNPLGVLIPKFLTLFSDARPQVRMYSIACVNHFVPLLPDADMVQVVILTRAMLLLR